MARYLAVICSMWLLPAARCPHTAASYLDWAERAQRAQRFAGHECQGGERGVVTIWAGSRPIPSPVSLFTLANDAHRLHDWPSNVGAYAGGK